ILNMIKREVYHTIRVAAGGSLCATRRPSASHGPTTSSPSCTGATPPFQRAGVTPASAPRAPAMPGLLPRAGDAPASSRAPTTPRFLPHAPVTRSPSLRPHVQGNRTFWAIGPRSGVSTMTLAAYNS
ncbi:hypothetical protein U9M48_033041, partial [Paspalum notatum var. saurae]